MTQPATGTVRNDYPVFLSLFQVFEFQGDGFVPAQTACE